MPRKILLIAIMLLSSSFASGETIFLQQALEVCQQDFFRQLHASLEKKKAPSDFRLREAFQACRDLPIFENYDDFRRELDRLLVSSPRLSELYQQFSLAGALEIDAFFQEELLGLGNLNENLQRALEIISRFQDLTEKQFLLILKDCEISPKKWKRIRDFRLPAELDYRLEFFMAVREQLDGDTDRDTAEYVFRILDRSEKGRLLWFQFVQHYFQQLAATAQLLEKTGTLE